VKDFLGDSHPYSTIAKAKGLIFSLFNVTSAREVPFAIPLYIKCILHGIKRRFPLQMEAIMHVPTTKSTLFEVSEWDTKEGPVIFIRATLIAEVILNSY